MPPVPSPAELKLDSAGEGTGGTKGSFDILKPIRAGSDDEKEVKVQFDVDAAKANAACANQQKELADADDKALRQRKENFEKLQIELGLIDRAGKAQIEPRWYTKERLKALEAACDG